MGALTGTQIATRVKRQFGDEAGSQFTDTDILDWINDALREITVENSLLQVKGTASTTAGTASYSLPVDTLRLFRVVYRGTALQFLSIEQATEEIPNKDDTSSYPSGTPQWYWIYPEGTVNIYPAPDNTGNNLTIYYMKRPTALTALTQTPETPAEYDGRIVEYCIAQARELDADPQGYMQKMGEFRDNMNRQKALNQNKNNDYYPFITDVNQYDFDGGWW